MKDISILFYERLLNFDKLTAYVGDRIYPLVLPNEAGFPSITFEKIGADKYLAMDRPAGLAKSYFQVNIWALSYRQVRLVQEQLRLCLEGHRDMSSDVMINCISFNSESDLYEGFSTTENDIFTVVSRWDVWHNEVQPF